MKTFAKLTLIGLAAIGLALVGCSKDQMLSPTGPQETPTKFSLQKAGATTIGTLEPPTTVIDIGKFKGIRYNRYKGRFAGQNSIGQAYSVPYEITAPANLAQGIGRLVVEPPHFTSGLLAREGFLGPEFLFGEGFCHASVGYSHLRQRILDPNPGFEVLVNGQPAPAAPPPPAPPLWESYTDREIIADFARALRQNPHGLVGSIQYIYIIGFSDSGEAVRRILEAVYGQNLFDLWFPGTTAPFNPIEGRGRVIVFNTEADFQAVNAVSPSYRQYVAAGCPHIPDTEFTRQQFPGPFPPPVAGTTPLNWNPFMRALFIAGDRWVAEGQEPPPSTVLELTPSGQITRDEKGNALGGIRHPALQLGEAHFIASQNINGWPLFGGYDQVSSIGDAGFFSNFGLYIAQFNKATKALLDNKFLLNEDATDLIRQATLNPQFTFTQNYQAGRFVP